MIHRYESNNEDNPDVNIRFNDACLCLLADLYCTLKKCPVSISWGALSQLTLSLINPPTFAQNISKEILFFNHFIFFRAKPIPFLETRKIDLSNDCLRLYVRCPLHAQLKFWKVPKMPKYKVNFLGATFYPQVIEEKIVQRSTVNGTH